MYIAYGLFGTNVHIFGNCIKRHYLKSPSVSCPASGTRSMCSQLDHVSILKSPWMDKVTTTHQFNNKLLDTYGHIKTHLHVLYNSAETLLTVYYAFLDTPSWYRGPIRVPIITISSSSISTPSTGQRPIPWISN